MVVGQAVTGGSTPKATLLEPTLFRRFFASSLLTESDGESVASVVKATEKDSKLDTGHNATLQLHPFGGSLQKLSSNANHFPFSPVW